MTQTPTERLQTYRQRFDDVDRTIAAVMARWGLPEVVYTTAPYALTVEGQYIIKNLVIIGAALTIGRTVRSRSIE